jgi:hypothetical protein
MLSRLQIKSAPYARSGRVQHTADGIVLSELTCLSNVFKCTVILRFASSVFSWLHQFTRKSLSAICQTKSKRRRIMDHFRRLGNGIGMCGYEERIMWTSSLRHSGVAISPWPWARVWLTGENQSALGSLGKFKRPTFSLSCRVSGYAKLSYQTLGRQVTRPPLCMAIDPRTWRNILRLSRVSRGRSRPKHLGGAMCGVTTPDRSPQNCIIRMKLWL